MYTIAGEPYKFRRIIRGSLETWKKRASLGVTGKKTAVGRRSGEKTS